MNWKDGEDVIIAPAINDEDAKTKFPKGWKALKPYLRLTPQPTSNPVPWCVPERQNGPLNRRT